MATAASPYIRHSYPHKMQDVKRREIEVLANLEARYYSPLKYGTAE